MAADRVCVGAIAGAFGVRGEVRLKSFCVPPEAIGLYGPLSDEAGREWPVRVGRAIKGGYAARLDGVPTREAAEALKGTRLHVSRSVLPALGDDEFYHADLVGLAVFDPGGRQLGTVRAIYDFGAGDVLEVVGLDGIAMIPFTRDAVPTVDIGTGRIVADLPDETEASTDRGDGDEG